ncbi:MAG: DUF4124 domain-containing protein [Methylococcaceae bacterium]|nr:DUF4124 domain-containing protein [Methylococcaceae bacterium]
MMRLFALLLILFFSVCAYPNIYKCRDAKGQMMFSDRATACGNTQPRSNVQPAAPPPVAAKPEIDKPALPAGQSRSVEKAEDRPSGETEGKNIDVEEDDSPNHDTFLARNSDLGGKEKIGFALLVIGGIISLIYGVILMVKAFQESVWWGLGYLFIPVVGFIFVAAHWEVSRRPFLRSLWALPFLVAGYFLID